MHTSVSIVQIFTLVIFVSLIALWIWSGIWAARDARERGKPGALVGLLVLLLAWPVSLLVWIALRPEHRREPFDLNRYRVQ